MTVLHDGQLKIGLVGMTGYRRLVVVTGVSRHEVRAVSLPHQPFKIDDAEFYGPLIRGQVAFPMSAGAYITPVMLSGLHPTNREFLEGLTITPLGADEVGYTEPTVTCEVGDGTVNVHKESETCEVCRPKRVVREPVKQVEDSLNSFESRPVRARPGKLDGKYLQETGATPVIPELRREEQFGTLHHLVLHREGKLTFEQLIAKALETPTFAGYKEPTLRWLIGQMVKHDILEVAE